MQISIEKKKLVYRKKVPILYIINCIKSKYIFIHIFSYLETNKKLDIIKYNKQLQKFFGVGFENYKAISKRFFKGDTNGKGKEYSKELNLIFEGEYLNGIRNGFGKEYYNIKDKINRIKFRGMYLDGKLIEGEGFNIKSIKIFEISKGEGKEYYNNGHIKFEGKYKNGERWEGKFYDIKGKV